MESGQPVRESRWHRTKAYLTVLALFQLISGTITVTTFVYYVLSVNSLVTPYLILASFGIIPIISSVMLFKKRRVGMYLSIPSLLLSLIAFPFSIFTMCNSIISSHPGDFRTPMMLFIVAFVSVIMIFTILLKEWKGLTLKNQQPK